ncbi:XdhC family protein [Nocardioides aequoreus]|uniref:XdhC family protein n=1 Tax=Nocardioides aequoreus TaxID=397278 RepID=UPI00068C396B|nr:XdhC family protein [Nocardioides aequoreus]
MTTPRERSWRDDEVGPGRLLVLSDNPVAQAVARIAEAVGLEVLRLTDDEDGRGLAAVLEAAPGHRDAVVLCDHDAPDAPAVLRAALRSEAAYVAMLASRRRAAGLLQELRDEGVPGLDKLHVPAGLDVGGRTPGEMALSLVAEVVADAHGRPGGPMRD